MHFLRTETMPLAKALQYYSFGQVHCESAEEFNGMQNLFKANIKAINLNLKGKQYMVGSQLTMVDIYLCLTQVEMQQCVMDSNLKNSLNFLNELFKNVTKQEAFVSRMGLVRPGKKQILPNFKA